MDGETGVLDVEQQGGGGEGEAGGEQDSGQGAGGQGEGQQQQLTPEQRQARADREYKTWLKTLRDSDPKTHAKFADQARNDRGRLIELARLEPRGIEGLREKYAILDSVSYDDPERGVLTGPEAVAALQDQVREMGEVDELLAAGDPRALEALGDDFNEGLAKLTPAILDRVMQADPEAYTAAVLPHFARALAQSDLVSGYNGLVDALNEQMPQWLPEDKKAAWIADKFRRVTELAGSMGTWLNAQLKAGGDGKGANVPRGTGTENRDQRSGGKPDKQAQERERFELEKATTHYATKITPGLNQHAEQKFSELFRPYAKRLHLDGTARTALAKAFTQAVTAKAMTPVNGRKNAYAQQMDRYWAQRTPDPAGVLNFAKVEFDKHARAVMEALINERYKPFLSGPRSQGTGNREQGTGTNGNGVKRAPVSPGVTVVGVKPAAADIDFKNTPIGWIHERKYRLTNGKVVQVRG